MKVERIDINKIKQVENSRGNVDKNLASLMNSIQQNGLQQPIGVNFNGKEYEIMYGNRRFHACMKLGWNTIPAVLYTEQNDKDFLIHNVVENVQRENITPVEIGRICENLKKLGLNTSEIAARTSLPESTIKSCIHVYSNFPEDLRNKVRFHAPGSRKDENLSMTNVEKVLSIRNKFGLTRQGVRDLMEHISVDRLSTSDIHIIGSLMQSGLNFKSASAKASKYRMYSAYIICEKEELECLSKKAGISPLRYLTSAVYGLQSPINKPSFVDINVGSKSLKKGRE